MINYFIIWLAAAVIMTFVFVASKNMNTGENPYSTVRIKSDPEQELLDKIYKLDHECSEMQSVLLTYNNAETVEVYCKLLSEKTQAELEWQSRYCHSRKVMTFQRI